MKHLKFIQGDITQAKVDAIVNAANSRLLGGGGVDGAIHRAAGPGLVEACRKIETINEVRCPPGEARITTAGNLKARYVIHTVGPRYGVDTPEERLLASAYKSCLDLAVAHECRSIAFPLYPAGYTDIRRKRRHASVWAFACGLNMRRS